MRKFLALTAAAALATLATAASAEVVAASNAPALTVKAGQTVVTSDGHRLGRIDRVEAERVGIIVDLQYIYVPTKSLSAGPNGRAVTALTYKQALAH